MQTGSLRRFGRHVDQAQMEPALGPLQPDHCRWEWLKRVPVEAFDRSTVLAAKRARGRDGHLQGANLGDQFSHQLFARLAL